MRSITHAMILAITALITMQQNSVIATTLVDWRFNEAGSGLVDPSLGVLNTYSSVPGAPVAPVLNLAAANPGNDPRDLVRLRADNGLWNYRNQAAYRTLSGTMNYIGYSGTPQYWGAYANYDQRGIYFRSDGTDILSTRNQDVFSNSDLSGGFTAQVVWRPGIQSDPTVAWIANFDLNGNMKDNVSGVLFTIENFVQVYYTDANSGVGTIDPRLVFAINGADASSMVSVPFDGTFFRSHSSWFEHTVAVYNPAGPDKLLLYRDGVLAGTSATGTLGNLDGNGAVAWYARETTVGSSATYYPSVDMALIDQIVISNDILIRSGISTPLGWVIPEPSAIGLALLGFGMLLRSRR